MISFNRAKNRIEHQIKSDLIIEEKKILKSAPIKYEKSMDDKVNEYFLRFYSFKLNELGEDKENYGNMDIHGESYPPVKMNLNYIIKRANLNELAKITHRMNKKFYEKMHIDDDYSKLDLNTSKVKLIENFKLEKLNLPIIKSRNKSMQNLPVLYLDKNISSDLTLQNKDKLYNSFMKSEIKNNISKIHINNIKKIDKKIEGIEKRKKNKKNNSYSTPILHNNIMITNKNLKKFFETNHSESQTEINKKNRILKRIDFLKRYDKKEGIYKKLNKLNDNLEKININMNKVINKSNEDIPQFKLRFNHLLKKLKSYK